MLPSCLYSPFWNVCSRCFPFFPKKKFSLKIELFIWHFGAALFEETAAMGGFGTRVRRNRCILLVLFLLQIQSLGLDLDSRPTARVCATHTISPGPKGEEEKVKFPI